MKIVVAVKLSLLSLMAISAVDRPAPAGASTLGVFVATSPCDAVSRPLLGIPGIANCEVIKWRLTLNQDTSTRTPTTYRLSYVYGSPQQGTTALSEGWTKVEREGKWAVVSGAKTGPDAVVYRLDPDKPQESISFLKLEHNLIHLLDGEGRLVVGHAGWSYTLNGAGGDERQTPQARTPSAPVANPEPLPAPARLATTDSTVVGAFVGRSPCREVAAQLNRAVNADCVKVKWDLTLFRDPERHTPTTYKLKGTFYRERVGEGRWAIVRGTRTDPAAVVYRLDPDKSQGSLLLLKADDNVLLFLDKERNLLVGNGDFSYTLNRAVNVQKN